MSTEFASSPHARWLEGETDRLFGFARGAWLPDGGFGLLDERGRVSDARTVDLLITCRMTHVFSIAHVLGRPGGGLLADHGLAALRTLFADRVNGGWYREVHLDSGLPADDRKDAYTHAFVLLAGSSAVQAQRPGARALLDAAVDVVERHFWDEGEGRVRESWDAAFGVDEPYRGANSNMHSVEAFLAAADSTGDPVWLTRALRIADWLINGVARANTWRVVEHFHADGSEDREYNADDVAHQYRPYGATIGHALEWSRLLLHLRAGLGTSAPGWLLEASAALFETAVLEGWGVDGADGFIYTTNWSGVPVVRARLHWVLAEAIGAAAALGKATGDRRYADLYQRFWDHAAVYFLDYEQGSWHHELDPTNRPSASVWSGKPDIYHALQTTLIPRLPLAPSLTAAVARGQLDAVPSTNPWSLHTTPRKP